MEDLASNDSFLNVLSNKLSDADLQRLLSFHGNVESPIPINNVEELKTDKEFIVKFDSREKLLKTMTAVYGKIDEIKKNISMIDSLPDHCLAHIFSFLSISDRLNIEKVCTRWRDISKRGWTGTTEIEIHRTDEDRIFSEEELNIIFQRSGRFLKKLLFTIINTRVNCLPIIIKYCELHQLEDIQILYFSEWSRDMESHRENLLEIFAKAKNLVSVEIVGSLGRISLDYLNNFPSTTLRKLELRYDEYGTARKQLIINIDQFPCLSDLCCHNIAVATEKKWSDQDLKRFVRIDLVDCKIPKKFIQNIKFCTNLTELCLQTNDNDIDYKNVCSIAKNCRKLEEFNLESLDEMKSSFLRHFAKLPSLERIFLGSFESLKSCDVQHLTNLRVLTLRDCEEVEMHGLIELIINSSKLEILNLFYVSSLGQPFLDEIGEVFSEGLRTLPLKMNIEVNCDDFFGEWEEPFHPLLDIDITYDEPFRFF